MARGKRKLIILDVFSVRKPGEGGVIEAQETRVITRMFLDSIEFLGITDLITDNSGGKTITAPNGNGEYRYLIRGCEGQQEITLVSSELTQNERNKTYRFRVPYWYPNYRITNVVKEWNTIIGFKRNGAVYLFAEE